MGQQRYTDEFRREEVRQVTEKDHPIRAVEARLGMSSYRLYDWIKQYGPANGTLSNWLSKKGGEIRWLRELRELNRRPCISEPECGLRLWKDTPAEQEALYAKHCRIRGERGTALLRRRGVMLERPLAHGQDTCGRRLVFFRGREYIQKRCGLHADALNLGLLLRAKLGHGAPPGRFIPSEAYFAGRMTLLCGGRVAPLGKQDG